MKRVRRKMKIVKTERERERERKGSIAREFENTSQNEQ